MSNYRRKMQGCGNPSGDPRSCILCDLYSAAYAVFYFCESFAIMPLSTSRRAILISTPPSISVNQ